MTQDSDPAGPPRAISSASSWLPARSLGLKLILVCALALAMSIPALFVWGVQADRASRARQVALDVGETVGGPQTLVGPVLVAPYERERPLREVRGSANQSLVERGLFVVYAQTGAARIDLISDTLRRSIFETPIYEASADFTATFDMNEARESANGLDVDWSAARIIMAASDLRGAVQPATISIAGGSPREAEPASDLHEFSAAYRAMAVDVGVLPSSGTFEVLASARFSGAGRIAAPAFAKDTHVRIAADWPHPSFEGGFLPDTRDISDAGFVAEWRVPYLARGHAGAGTAGATGLAGLAGTEMGVRFVQLSDVYTGVGRALKYALMFIGFVFLAFFLFEVTSGKRVHAAQYVLIGLAQAVFYLLLLAIAEQAGFDIAFAAAAGLTVSATALYAGAVYGARSYAVRALVVFSLVYGLLYVLMRLEDLALLVGALASFAAIAATMYMTRKVNWYGGGEAASG